MSESLANLQPKLPFPRKAVAGWQTEVLDAVRSGLDRVIGVR